MNKYFKYWGKAEKDGDGYHLLVYHCLDVAAVAASWWEEDKALRDSFVRASGIAEKMVRAWLLFFIALHDLGKFDVRFQLKAKEIALSLNPLFCEADPSQSRDFDHGRYGKYWFEKVSGNFGFQATDETALHQWISAVCGHHGKGFGISRYSLPNADDGVIEHDRQARSQWMEELNGLFLKNEGIESFEQIPVPPDLLAGFCSVCDWLGSNAVFFPYINETSSSLRDYFYSRKDNSKSAIRESGILARPAASGGMAALFPEYRPHGVQLLTDNLPLETGLTLIEAPTGSGKTEAALAYASRLLAVGLADSIVFALPTQATANAMLERLEKISGKLFPAGVNVVLAHGKARFNSNFLNLQKASIGRTAQGGEEALAQCAQWLATSRKRVFLGQIGVCTVDQVLLSVLPIRHHFVRAFGILKSILIIDEIHAYDSYMNGLLDLVLKSQHKAEGSSILLSATLPAARRSEIFKTWDAKIPSGGPAAPYPLITHAGTETINWESPEPAQSRTVELSIIPTDGMVPPVDLLSEISHAVRRGANVAVICNLVNDAQKVARQLMYEQCVEVDIFHSRFRFMDRQRVEKGVMEKYGKGAPRNCGHILVATQVVEQSLDLDFDWMITQLCPVDLFFQRLGRLHRHDVIRPADFEIPRCTVLASTNEDYGLHALIYGNERVLWRTQKLLERTQILTFPKAYREWIETVYDEDRWDEEPDEITKAHDKYLNEQDANRYKALTIGNADASPLADTDGNVTALTRDGEMSLNVIPVIMDGRRRFFLDGTAIDELSEWEQDEALNMNTIPVPHSWRRNLPDDEEGLIFLSMAPGDHKGWIGYNKDWTFTYHLDFGLERRKS